MKTRFEITAADAQKIMYTQTNDILFSYFFESGYNDAELTMPEEDVISETDFSILKTEENGEVSYQLDWKNEIMGLGTGFWGHEPMELEANTDFLRFPLNEYYSEAVED